MNLYRYQDHNLWEQINRANKKEIAAGIYQKIFFLFFRIWHFWKTKWVISFHSGLANYWAELDLNQRRHIANEFTVRPH